MHMCVYDLCFVDPRMTEFGGQANIFLTYSKFTTDPKASAESGLILT